MPSAPRTRSRARPTSWASAGVAKLAHRLEDVLEICEADAVAPSEHRARALMAAADCLAQMVAAVAGEDAPPDNALAVIEMLDAARDNNFAPDGAAPFARRRLPPGRRR